MADLRLVWDPINQRADWTVVNGRLAADGGLESVVLLLLFTDRKAQVDYVPTDRTNNLRGWWADTFQTQPIGSRLWQLDRRKITDHGAIEAEAQEMVLEALNFMIDWGVATAITCIASCPRASSTTSGTLLTLSIGVTEAAGKTTSLSYAYNLT